MAMKTRTMHLILLASSSAVWVHCAESSMYIGDAAFDTGMNESSNMATTAASATSPSENDASQTLAMDIDGTLTISAGALDLSASSIVTSVYVGLDTTKLLCSQTGIRSAEATKPPRGEDALYGWWQVEPEPHKDCESVPEVLDLGIGEYSPLLDSSVIARGEDPKSLSYSVYMRLDEQSPLWVFGIADYSAPLSSEQTDSGSPGTPSDLPDGLYSFTGVILIPLS